MIFELLMKTASGLAPGVRGPGPAKPVNPNAVKPLMLGLPHAQNGEEDEAAQQALAQQQEANQQGLEAQAQTQQAQMEAQQARNEAVIAKQQAALAKEQQRATTSASSGGHAMNSSILKASLKNMSGKVQSLTAASIGKPTSLLKVAADTRTMMKRVEPYNAHGEFAADAKRHGVNAEGKSDWTFGDFFEGVQETAKNPDQMTMSKMEQPWHPMGGEYRPGSIGATLAPAVNTRVDSYRHVLNNLPVMGQNILGAVSLSGQALGKSWDIGRDWVNMLRRDGLNARLQDSAYLGEAADLAKRAVWPTFMAMGSSTPMGFASTTGFMAADDMAQQHAGKPLTQVITDKVSDLYKWFKGGDGGEVAQQASQVPEKLPEQTMDPGIVEWIMNLLMQMGQRGQSQPARPLPSEVGAAGHVVRNPYALF